MKFFVGIDLGTTNSAISTFDGTEVRLRKFFPPTRKLREKFFATPEECSAEILR